MMTRSMSPLSKFSTSFNFTDAIPTRCLLVMWWDEYTWKGLLINNLIADMTVTVFKICSYIISVMLPWFLKEEFIKKYTFYTLQKSQDIVSVFICRYFPLERYKEKRFSGNNRYWYSLWSDCGCFDYADHIAYSKTELMFH